ncbi:hypothetical protein P168DRAFT_335130 [Aspergillus campestris IBT 28561]|uniref:Uncharacterized protein n=1 Tax=Aspergillus campestris (strain IBT 28561) TaxID=1392248 RepID=A0A2I1CU24_ASPC2|nr:uncharacterized protein P168DRAFT_335130 [Aspergillus campestris IBT 28561]PKY01132.1 hypothetical protein P168DRAFT_335130 [Aspergillus campestris IBT 28561]
MSINAPGIHQAWIGRYWNTLPRYKRYDTSGFSCQREYRSYHEGVIGPQPEELEIVASKGLCQHSASESSRMVRFPRDFRDKKKRQRDDEEEEYARISAQRKAETCSGKPIMQSHHGRGHQAAWNHASLPSIIGFSSHLWCACDAGLTLFNPSPTPWRVRRAKFA